MFILYAEVNGEFRVPMTRPSRDLVKFRVPMTRPSRDHVKTGLTLNTLYRQLLKSPTAVCDCI